MEDDRLSESENPMDPPAPVSAPLVLFLTFASLDAEHGTSSVFPNIID